MKKSTFILGWIYFGLMFILEAVLPEWMGNENSVIENLQILWFFVGIWYCYKMASTPMYDWGGSKAPCGTQVPSFSYCLQVAR